MREISIYNYYVLQFTSTISFSNDKKKVLNTFFVILRWWWWRLMNQSYQIILNSLMPAGLIFFCLSLFTRYSPGLYMIGRVRNRNFLLKSMLSSGLKDEILKSVLSEIWHIWVQMFSRQKNRPLIGWPIRSTN